MRSADSLEKILMLRKTEGRKRRGQKRMRCLDGIANSKDMSLNRFLGVGEVINYTLICDDLIVISKTPFGFCS